MVIGGREGGDRRVGEGGGECDDWSGEEGSEEGGEGNSHKGEEKKREGIQDSL